MQSYIKTAQGMDDGELLDTSLEVLKLVRSGVEDSSPWKGHEGSLCYYGYILAAELRERGRDTALPVIFQEHMLYKVPVGTYSKPAMDKVEVSL